MKKICADLRNHLRKNKKKKKRYRKKKALSYLQSRIQWKQKPR